MYRVNEILESWGGLIGWRQNYDPNGKQLENEVTASESGMYYQDEHPMLTLQNLESIMPDYSLVNYPAWDGSTDYLKNEIVKSGGIEYKAKEISKGKDPATNPNLWKRFNPFSEWIKEKTEAGMQDVIMEFLEGKEINKTAKAILEDRTLFDGLANKKNTIPKSDKRAGFEIYATRTKGITPVLNRIGAQFTTAGEFTIYLHHSSRQEPLKELKIYYTDANSLQWFDLDWRLPYVSKDNDSGGAYYITYLEREAPGDAIRKDKVWNELPCETMESSTEVATWKLYSRFLEFHPFTTETNEAGDFDDSFNNDFATADFLEANEHLWDISKNRYDNNSNYGLNLAISLYCDYTDLFIEQRDLFKSVLRKQVAMNLLRELAYNPNSRINQNESTVKREQLLYEIDGDTRGRNTGIKYKYSQAMDAISLNTEGLNRICLPCKGNGVRYRTV